MQKHARYRNRVRGSSDVYRATSGNNAGGSVKYKPGTCSGKPKMCWTVRTDRRAMEGKMIPHSLSTAACLVLAHRAWTVQCDFFGPLGKKAVFLAIAIISARGFGRLSLDSSQKKPPALELSSCARDVTPGLEPPFRLRSCRRFSHRKHRILGSPWTFGPEKLDSRFGVSLSPFPRGARTAVRCPIQPKRLA